MAIHQAKPLIVLGEAELSLSDEVLYGWEKWVGAEKIGTFMDAIDRGDRFPRVAVTDRGTHFSLAYWANRDDDPEVPDGGHHRSVAHYLARVPLRVLVVATPADPPYFEFNESFEIRNITNIPIY